MRISDWSSDVCSSDLMMRHRVERLAGGLFGFRIGHGEAPVDGRSKAIMLIPISARRRAIARARDQLGSIRVACDIIRTKAGKSDAMPIMAPAMRRFSPIRQDRKSVV